MVEGGRFDLDGGDYAVTTAEAYTRSLTLHHKLMAIRHQS